MVETSLARNRARINAKCFDDYGSVDSGTNAKQRCDTHLNMHTRMGEKVHYKNGSDSQ